MEFQKLDESLMVADTLRNSGLILVQRMNLVHQPSWIDN